MAKTAPSDSPETAVKQAPINKWRRRLFSALIMIHLAAVIAPPLNFATVGSGPARWLYQTMRPYSQAAYLDHGYFFFAPDPGPSHLVRFRAEFEGDREPLVEVFPDKTKQWPRLLYHRHFMLTEHLHAAFAPPEAPPGLDERGMREWRGARDLYEARWDGFERHLKAKYNAKQVTLTRVEHRPPGPLEFLEGRRLDDGELYVDLPERLERDNRAGQGGIEETNVPETRPPIGPVGPLGPVGPTTGPFGPPMRPLEPAGPTR